MLRSTEKTLKGARSGGPVPQGTRGRKKKEKKKGSVLVFVAPCVASHTGRCHLTNGQLETEQQLEQLQPEEKQIQGLAERPGGLKVRSRTAGEGGRMAKAALPLSHSGFQWGNSTKLRQLSRKQCV